MEALDLWFFPFPHFLDGDRRDGLMFPWHRQCGRCNSECDSSKLDGLQICRWGVNYRRVTPDLLIAGVIATDFPSQNPAFRKARQDARANHTTRAEIDAVAERVLELTQAAETEYRQERERAIDEYRATRGYQRDLVELLRPEIRQVLAQVHDYRQFVQQVLQNLDVVLEPRAPNRPLEEKIQRASQQEQAIYWAARLMDEKLDAALFYLEPDRIAAKRRRFRLHGAVTKIRKIYDPVIASSGLTIEEVGQTWAYVEGNPDAFSAVPHALIDNAVKYAPPSSSILLLFEEAGGRVLFAVESEGPKIADHERARIFDPFVRGESARQAVPGGMGFGLAQAQLIVHEMGAELSFEQDPTPTSTGLHRTRFFVRFDTVDAPAEAEREDAELQRRLDGSGR